MPRALPRGLIAVAALAGALAAAARSATPTPAAPAPFLDDFSDAATFAANWQVSDYTNSPGANGGTEFQPANARLRQDRFGHYLDLTLTGCRGAAPRACGAEVVSQRVDFSYGRYRFVAAVPDTRALPCPQGAVLGLFTFLSPDVLNEIDLEFLRRIVTLQHGRCAADQDVTDRIFTVSHTPAGSFPHQGYSPLIGRAHLGTPVTYGFDWAPTQLTFYVAGVPVTTLTGPHRVPQLPSHILLNTWAGEALYGGLAPAPGTAVHSRIYSVRYTPDFFPP